MRSLPVPHQEKNWCKNVSIFAPRRSIIVDFCFGELWQDMTPASTINLSHYVGFFFVKIGQFCIAVEGVEEFKLNHKDQNLKKNFFSISHKENEYSFFYANIEEDDKRCLNWQKDNIDEAPLRLVRSKSVFVRWIFRRKFDMVAERVEE